MFSIKTQPSTDSEDCDDSDYFPAPADHWSTKNEISTDMWGTNSISVNDYVLINEGELKHREMYSVEEEIIKLNVAVCKVL